MKKLIIENILLQHGLISYEIYFRLVISSILGFLIGFDRTKKYKPIGLKTYTLIAVGSSLVTIISIEAVSAFSVEGNTMMDPMRLVAQLLPAVGFVGAGTILHMEDKVKGLTSAAFVFFAAVIGVGIGAGFYGVTIFTFLLTFVILKISSIIENHFDDTKDIE